MKIIKERGSITFWERKKEKVVLEVFFAQFKKDMSHRNRIFHWVACLQKDQVQVVKISSLRRYKTFCDKLISCTILDSTHSALSDTVSDTII